MQFTLIRFALKRSRITNENGRHEHVDSVSSNVQKYKHAFLLLLLFVSIVLCSVSCCLSNVFSQCGRANARELPVQVSSSVRVVKEKWHFERPAWFSTFQYSKVSPFFVAECLRTIAGFLSYGVLQLRKPAFVYYIPICIIHSSPCLCVVRNPS